jgi:hypothetical protein
MKQQILPSVEQNSNATDSIQSDNQQTTSNNNNNNVAKTIVKGAKIAGGIAATAYAGKKIKKAYDNKKQLLNKKDLTQSKEVRVKFDDYEL